MVIYPIIKKRLKGSEDEHLISTRISIFDATPLVRVPWNDPALIMKSLDAGSYGIICPMVSNKSEAERFVQACMYPPQGYRSFGPVRGLIYGGSDYANHANDELLKFAMIETNQTY